MNNENGLCAGLAGVKLGAAEYSLGHGIKLRQTFAHMMAPFMMAFSPAQPGKPHPAPWAAVKGGFGFDIEVEIELPSSQALGLPYEQNFLIWLIVALLRLRVSPSFVVPVVGLQSVDAAKASHSTAIYYPIEAEQKVLIIDSDARRVITDTDLMWLQKHWLNAANLYQRNGVFQLLFEATDQCIFARHEKLALLWLWGGLESIFPPDKTELKYRISTYIASFLEPAGLSRMNSQKSIAKLYDSRSAAAHGRQDAKEGSLRETYQLASRSVLKIIENNHVPTHIELEAKLFGADPF